MPVCAEDGCQSPGAYRTRTKPSWCEVHIREMFERGRVRLIEPFTRPADHLLVECLDCGCQTHMRFVFLQELLGTDRHGCEACRWRQWAAEAREMRNRHLPFPVAEEIVDVTAVRELAESNNYEYLGPLTDPSLFGDPHHVRCRSCNRLHAERMGDIGWGCSCRVNRKRAKPETPSQKRDASKLFKNSESRFVKWWAHDLNLQKDWDTATVNARRVVWWRCPDCGHEFEAKVLEMAGGYSHCRPCDERRTAQRREQEAVWAKTMVSEIPELLAMWDDDADPSTTPVYVDGYKFGQYQFRCPIGHRRTDEPYQVLLRPCPRCMANETRNLNQELRDHGETVSSIDPEMRAQWHPERNGKLTPEKVGPGSRREIWWRDPVCGHEWIQSPRERDKRYRFLCPACETKLGSMAAFYPELAEQWAPENPLTPWHILPLQKLNFTPDWICPQNPQHRWSASNISRVNGSECPQCVTTGKSRIELQLFEAIRALDPTAESGTPVYSEAFARRKSWRPDVVALGGTAVLEYDGSFWHADKLSIDQEKSRDLLAAGIPVFRVREDPLPSVGIADPRYAEAFEYFSTIDVHSVAQRFVTWAEQVTKASTL